MVKAYLKYQQHDVFGGFVSSSCNITTCELKNGSTSLGLHVVSACNEVVYLMNNNTSEIAYKIYDTEA
jgi:hypothetical protein